MRGAAFVAPFERLQLCQLPCVKRRQRVVSEGFCQLNFAVACTRSVHVLFREVEACVPGRSCSKLPLGVPQNATKIVVCMHTAGQNSMPGFFWEVA